ncbi:hypothetical protein PV11_03301 [Exophiala sideris]|uniref:Uncharacterized protein n=1 Tax=Exophiala sideris TaxID=1016849 RepID=A0A0D1Z1J4_9EURO|nr:hypothetical protein PV11_03301 [Exophiala sideris]
MCEYWSKLPASEYYLGASIADLKYMMHVKGDFTGSPLKLSESIFWHTTWSELLGPCPCAEKSHTAHSARVQWLSSKDTEGNSSEIEQVQLPDTGAVIFGYNKGLEWSMPSVKQTRYISWRQDRPETGDKGQPAFGNSGPRESPSSPELSGDNVTTASSSQLQPSQSLVQENDFMQGVERHTLPVAQLSPLAQVRRNPPGEIVLPSTLTLGSRDRAVTSDRKSKGRYWPRTRSLGLLDKIRADIVKAGKKRDVS